MSRTRVAVIGGGPSSEHEVSLASAAAAAQALREEGYDVVELTLLRSLDWAQDGRTLPEGLADAVHLLRGADVVLPVLHGPGGEDGTVAALLDLAGVAYVGSGVRAGALGMDKAVTKLLAESLGIPTAGGVVLTASDGLDRARALGLPLVVKPCSAGSSFGVSLVRSGDELAGAVRAALDHDDRVLVEPVVEGREVDVAVLQLPDGSLLAGPSLEIRLGGGRALFDTAAKYHGGAEFSIPADLPPATLLELEDAALAMFRVLGCRGVARIDFFVTEAGPVLNEVNTMPGFTPQSQVPKMFAAAGFSYGQLLRLLVEGAFAGAYVPAPRSAR